MFLISAALGAHAGSVGYDFRFDRLSKDYDKDTNAAGTNDFSKMFFHRARIDFKGSAEEGLDYRVRFRFDQTTAGVNERDKVSSFVDFAFVTHKFNENMALTLGKFMSEIGGYEAAFIADRYAESALWKSNSAPSLAAINHWLYSGVKLEFFTGEQTFALHLANQEPSDVSTTVPPATTASFSQNANMTGLVWKGTIAEMWKTSWAYHTVGTTGAQGATGTEKGNKSFITLGNRFAFDAFMVDFDYMINSSKDSSDAAFAGKGATANLSGFTLAAAYKMESLTPKFEYSSATYKNKASESATENDTKFTNTALALEYMPGPKGLRYHVAYGMRDTKLTGAANTIKETDIIMGARFTGDFLKN
jgi:hypothetical protein